MTYVEARMTYVTYADVCNLQETACGAVEALSAAEARIAAYDVCGGDVCDVC
jgi:hypothetical protein